MCIKGIIHLGARSQWRDCHLCPMHTPLRWHEKVRAREPCSVSLGLLIRLANPQAGLANSELLGIRYRRLFGNHLIYYRVEGSSEGPL